MVNEKGTINKYVEEWREYMVEVKNDELSDFMSYIANRPELQVCSCIPSLLTTGAITGWALAKHIQDMELKHSPLDKVAYAESFFDDNRSFEQYIKDNKEVPEAFGTMMQAVLNVTIFDGDTFTTPGAFYYLGEQLGYYTFNKLNIARLNKLLKKS